MAYENWTIKKLFGSDSESKLADPEFSQYVQELGSYSSEKLVSEPHQLAGERLHLQEETENLAFTNYKTFIQAANCSKEIYDDFTLVENHLETVVDRLPSLAEKCRDFLQEAQKISGRRTADSLALSKHPQIVEILEMPQVMDTCVRAGYWEEALELAQYVTKLQRRTGHIPVIQNVAREVLMQRQVLLDQLLDQLHSQLNLSQCLRVVGYLRRLGVFTESELRIKFLMARDSWFNSILKTIPDSDPYQHITKVIEVSRNNLFDVVAHYKAAFSDDDIFQMSVLPSSQRETLPTHLPAILHSWMFQKIEQFLEMLHKDLQKGVANRLDAVLAQSMYFGLSFARIGADFRPLISPLFEDAVFADFAMAVDQATARLLDELHADFIRDVRVGSHKTLGYSSGGPTTDDGRVDVTPPMSLLDWTPLAIYCNAVLSAFNSVRLCLPLTLVPRFVHILQESLLLAVRQISAIYEHGFEQINKSNQETVGAVCSLFTVDLVPFLNRCLETLFPVASIASVLGMGVGQALEMEGLRIDLEAVREPIINYLPKPAVVTGIHLAKSAAEEVGDEERAENSTDNNVKFDLLGDTESAPGNEESQLQ